MENSCSSSIVHPAWYDDKNATDACSKSTNRDDQENHEEEDKKSTESPAEHDSVEQGAFCLCIILLFGSLILITSIYEHNKEKYKPLSICYQARTAPVKGADSYCILQVESAFTSKINGKRVEEEINFTFDLSKGLGNSNSSDIYRTFTFCYDPSEVIGKDWGKNYNSEFSYEFKVSYLRVQQGYQFGDSCNDEWGVDKFTTFLAQEISIEDYFKFGSLEQQDVVDQYLNHEDGGVALFNPVNNRDPHAVDTVKNVKNWEYGENQNVWWTDGDMSCLGPDYDQHCCGDSRWCELSLKETIFIQF